LPEDLAEAAAGLGHQALALADRGGLSGAPRFFKAARKLGLQPIVGAEIAIESPGAPVPPLLLLVEIALATAICAVCLRP